MEGNTNKSPTAPQPITHDDGTLGQTKRKGRRRAWVSIVLGSIGVLLGVISILLGMYNQALLPVDTKDTTERTVEIVSGSTPSDIGKQLKGEDVIRSEIAFGIYTRVQGVQNTLQAGTYQFKKSQSTQEIVAALAKGPTVDEFEVTFLPGATLQDHRKALVTAGFSETEVDAAFAARYDHPLFAGRPASADLEGYIYGETHRFTHGTTVEQVLQRYFDDYYTIITENHLVERYKAQGLSLYQGITLASIVQKEVSGEGDSRQVAQVFYKRLAENIPLGADATFVYAAKKNGDTPSVDYPSPYNTRVHGGLPPGPISSPGKEALLAVADPAEGDYLFFVSGDDGKNYFSRTEAEHIENTRKYCIKNCALF